MNGDRKLLARIEAFDYRPDRRFCFSRAAGLFNGSLHAFGLRFNVDF